MPVIIHDFEITVAPPAEKKSGTESAESNTSEPAPSLRPEDIARIERHYRERQKRIQAD